MRATITVDRSTGRVLRLATGFDSAVELDQLANLCVTAIATAAGAAGANDVFNATGTVQGNAVGDGRLLDLEAMADHPVCGFRLSEHGREKVASGGA